MYGSEISSEISDVTSISELEYIFLLVGPQGQKFS